ncbi:MAG: phospholipase D-like domain-containing protein [Nanoarchaeota archaeon]|nr:phospholipase D-like domain-containing protein [Nanoarchaeota archaeon]
MMIKQSVVFILLTIFLTGCSINNAVTAEVYPQDQGTIELYFCPHQNCEGALVSLLDSAEQSIHCALFDIGLPSVQQKLLDKEKEIEVMVVTDNDYLKKFNHPFVKTDSYGLMHNKFCIIDGTKVSTGSMNPTENDAHKNNNNLLLIESNILAQNYEDEFQELWGGTFKRGSRVKNPKVTLNDKGTKKMSVETYFCPEDACAEQVKKELKKAEKSIYFMAFSFTHDGIANVLLLKNLDGIEVKGVMEVKQISEYSQFNRLLQNKIDVIKDGNKNNLHHKVFIIDEETVVTGSFNPTANGDKHNDENLLIIEDEGIAKRFTEEFERVYKEGSE